MAITDTLTVSTDGSQQCHWPLRGVGGCRKIGVWPPMAAAWLCRGDGVRNKGIVAELG